MRHIIANTLCCEEEAAAMFAHYTLSPLLERLQNQPTV
jgi:hypothetical protein